MKFQKMKINSVVYIPTNTVNRNQQRQRILEVPSGARTQLTLRLCMHMQDIPILL